MDPDATTDAVAEPEVPSSQLPELTMGSVAGTVPDANYQPTIRGKIEVARVRIKEGNGQFVINGRPMDEYLRIERDRDSVMVPLKAVGKVGQVDVSIRVEGGGTTGQAGAIILGIARALQGMNPAWHHTLADAGLLTRDDRMVERKKYGFKKARKSFQFSKR